MQCGAELMETQERLPVPDWLKVKLPKHPHLQSMRERLRSHRLVTVCESARCPNIGECFSRGTATFMLLGEQCTRRCGFCAVTTGRPLPPDPDEPKRVAQMVKKLGLRHAVITSVARDELLDQGASQFANSIDAIRSESPGTDVEVLTPDFHAKRELIEIIVLRKPDVYNHNLETVARLQNNVRPQSGYERSLAVLRIVKELEPTMVTKSGLMMGLGEEPDEVMTTLRDLRNVGCDIVTIGQYIRPTQRHLPVVRYVPPREFDAYSEVGRSLGFRAIVAGPFVRSSYLAERALEDASP